MSWMSYHSSSLALGACMLEEQPTLGRVGTPLPVEDKMRCSGERGCLCELPE